MRGWLALGGGWLLVGAAAPAERVVGPDGLIDVTVNGRPLKLRIEPDAPGLPLIGPAQARALGLKGGGMFAFGVGFSIGKEQFRGRTESAKFGLAGGKPEGRRVGWLSRDYVPVADGSIGPAGLPEPVVRFQLRAERSGETLFTAPLDIEGGLAGALFASWFYLPGVLRIGEARVRVRFDPHHPQTLATAPAAIALAKVHGGVMTPRTGRQAIAFGVERPYRMMKLARPLELGGLRLGELGVRVTDEDVTGRIPEEGAVAVEPDPDEVPNPNEVVVTARSRKPRIGVLSIGADALARCSSITFDKAEKEVRLSCLAAE